MGLGFGAYASYDYRLATIGSNSYDIYNEPSLTRDKMGQYGIVFDTNVSKNSIFNYRLNLGLDISTINFSYTDYDSGSPVSSSNSIDVWKIIFDNTFGFGIARSDFFRLWVGPQVGFGIGFQKTDYSNNYYGTSSDFLELDLHVGFVIGLNIHIGDAASICGDIGVRLHESAMNIGFFSLGGGVILDSFANVSVLLRVNDTFAPPKVEPTTN